MPSILFFIIQRYLTIVLRRSLLTICLLASFNCFALSTHKQVETKSQSHAVCIPEIQSIQTTKETELSPTGIPSQARWSNIENLPDKWNKRWPDYQGNVWYRILWNYQCPNEQWVPLSLMIDSINMTSQIFVNEHLLWQSRSLTSPLSMHWNMPQQWSLLPAGLKQGQNEVLIRVIPNHIYTSGIGEIFIGNSSDINPLYERIWFKKRGVQIYTLIFELVLTILALLIWIFRPQEKAFGWYSICTFLWIIYLGKNLLLEPLMFLDAATMARINSIIFLLFAWTSCLYAWRFANKAYRSFEKLCWGMLVLGILLIILAPEKYLIYLLDASFIVGFSTYMINCLTFPIIAFKSKRIDAILLGGMMILIYFPLGIHDGWYMFKGDAILWSPYATPFTTIILVVIFALRLTDSLKHVELFNETLKTTIAETKAELLESIGKTHQLELKNAKLNERIQLAHDLHDGLGGSLVRSMSLVEQQKEKLNKDQVLSMLKHLRDDLRQIIDTSSCLNARYPENPIIWLAPIRHRFCQLFDELDIYITWNLPEKWLFDVDISDCFAYQRVIEEALTNVVKHSYATEVYISLKFDSNGVLRLYIIDNGVGFNINAVEQAGLSVGMRSIKSRMNKIQANFKISSESRKTELCITKKYLT